MDPLGLAVLADEGGSEGEQDDGDPVVQDEPQRRMQLLSGHADDRSPACQTAQMNASRVARALMLVMGAIAALCIAGLVTMVVLSDNGYRDYGEMDIPGSAVIDLPAGKVIVSFHTKTSGHGTSVPPLRMDIEPPPGVRDPGVYDALGGSVTVNNDVHRQVWVMQVDTAGRYPVSIDGPVADYEEPRLAFGRERGTEGMVWVLVAASMITTDLAIAAWWFQRTQKRKADEGVRLEQLKTITALRDSGALTENEFEAEKLRILKGQ